MTRGVSILATREVIHLHTVYVCPPIPIRNFDWRAIDENNYDASYEDGRYVSTSSQGQGHTEAEAIQDLFNQIEERQ